MCTDASRLAQKKYNASPQGKETRRKQKEKKKQERYLPEEISSTVDGYEINGNVVTLRSGKVEVREGSAKQLDKGAIAFLKKQKISTDDKVTICIHTRNACTTASHKAIKDNCTFIT